MPGSLVSTRSRRRSVSVAAVRHHHHSGVLRVADADAAAVMYGNPRSAGRGIHQRVEQRPVGDGVGAVAHGFGLAERRSDRAGVEVIAADHDGRFQLAVPHQPVHGQAELGALAVAQPADARGQSLKLDALAAPAASSAPAFRRAGTSRAPAGRCGRCLPDRPRAPPSGTARGLRRTAGGCTRARSRGCRRRARRRRPCACVRMLLP